MPLFALQITIFLLGVITLVSGMWLFVHARDVMRLFRSEPDIEPGPGPRVASRTLVIAMLAIFNAGWIAAIAFWSWSIQAY